MMAHQWGERHAEILDAIFTEFNEYKILYCVSRNYKGLPQKNQSKDVDIIVEPAKVNLAKKILKKIYKNHNIHYYYEAKYTTVFCCYGIDYKSNFSIHIDLISSIVSKGFEVFSFDEIYSYSKQYKDFYVLNDLFEAVSILLFKQFNQQPYIKKSYENIICSAHEKHPEFKKLITRLLGEELTNKIFKEIENKNFNEVKKYSSELSKVLRRYCFKEKLFRTIKLRSEYFFDKLDKIILNYSKYSKVFSVMAPDGAGKTTFIDNLLNEITYYFVNSNYDERCTIYHFRPNLLPNLGELGEKAKIKEQDKDFTNPHRANPAGKISSFIRICYYWLDYIIGYNLFVRKDVKLYKFSIFDRYSYDLIVDPHRSRIKLPLWIRKLFVKCMPHPKIVFYLCADPEVIFQRKQELTLEEIKRQNEIYLDLAKSHKRFKILDANRHCDESVNEALEIILDTFCEKLK